MVVEPPGDEDGEGGKAQVGEDSGVGVDEAVGFAAGGGGQDERIVCPGDKPGDVAGQQEGEHCDKRPKGAHANADELVVIAVRQDDVDHAGEQVHDDDAQDVADPGGGLEVCAAGTEVEGEWDEDFHQGEGDENDREDGELGSAEGAGWGADEGEGSPSAPGMFDFDDPGGDGGNEDGHQEGLDHADAGEFSGEVFDAAGAKAADVEEAEQEEHPQDHGRDFEVAEFAEFDGDHWSCPCAVSFMKMSSRDCDAR